MYDEWDKDKKDLALRKAEKFISTNASKALKKLPSVEPLLDSELDFNIKKINLSVQDSNGHDIEFESIGSDQNYLALHLALFFSLHKLFLKRNRPVPSVLFVDQVSRPYYPPETNKEEIVIDSINADADSAALKKHIDFLFDEVDNASGQNLQVILIEHAYFTDDKRYVNAVKYRWSSDNKLIPSDWAART